jgi:acetyl-CoA acyltransferase
MRDAVIVDAVRTPIAKGKPTGAYHDIHPVDLHAHALRALVDRTPGPGWPPSPPASPSRCRA